MKKSELKQLIREVVDEMTRGEFLKNIGMGAVAVGGLGAGALGAEKGVTNKDKELDKDTEKIVKIFSEILVLRQQAKDVAKTVANLDTKSANSPRAIFNKRLMSYVDDSVFKDRPKERESLYSLYIKEDLT